MSKWDEGGESRKRGKEGIWFRIDVEGTACAKKKIIIIKEEILSVPVITHVFLVRGYCIFRLLSWNYLISFFAALLFSLY